MATQDLIFRLIGQTDNLRKDLKRVNGQFNSIKTAAFKVGAAMGVAFGGQEVLRAIGSGIRKIADFEEQMDKVAAISRAAPKDIQRLSDNALELGRVSKFTATQIGSMQEVLARLGFTSRQIIKTTDAVRKLATAAGEELAPSAEVMAGTMKSFNIEASESEKVANVMAESFSTTSLNLEKFGVAMSNVGAIANVANVSLEDTTAMIGTLTDRNIDASKAGTDLRKIFIELAAKGISYQDAMAQIRVSTDKVTTATNLFGVRASAAAIILADNEKKVTELAAGYKDANQELSNMVDIMEDNLNTDIKLLESAIDGVIQKGGAFNGFLRQAVQNMTTLVSQINDGIQANNGFSQFLENSIAASPFNGLAIAWKLLTNNAEDYADAQKQVAEEQKKIEKAIQSTVEAAFKSGNIEAYIKALDQNIHKEEIILRIRERQKKIADEQAGIEQKRIDKVNMLVAAKRKERKEMEGIHQLQTLGIDGAAQSAFQQQLSNFERFNQLLGDIKTNIQSVQLTFQPLAHQFQNAAGYINAMGDAFLDVRQIIADFASTSLVALGEELGNALTGVGKFGESIISAIGNFMSALGQQMIEMGVAQVVLQKLEKLGTKMPGGVLIAAGVALVAASKAISNTFSAGIGGVSASGGSSGAARGLSDINRSTSEQQVIELRASGKDMLAVITNAQRSNKNRGGVIFG